MIDGKVWRGNPFDRDIEKIRVAVMDELISVERARDVYGVVIDQRSIESPNPENVKVQYKATIQLTKGMKDQKRKKVRS